MLFAALSTTWLKAFMLVRCQLALVACMRGLPDPWAPAGTIRVLDELDQDLTIEPIDPTFGFFPILCLVGWIGLSLRGVDTLAEAAMIATKLAVPIVLPSWLLLNHPLYVVLGSLTWQWALSYSSGRTFSL